MARLIKKDRGNYTNVSNILLRDERLSWKARGIFCYLWSQANEWQFYVAEIAKHATDGVKSLRSGIDELETYGYLQRKNRHSNSGNFDGMDWILDDTGTLKKSQVDSDSNRHDHLGDDAKKEQNPQKKCQKTSDAKDVGRNKGSTQNGTVRNNNNKNYQYKESSNSINSSSSNSSSDNYEKEKPDPEEVVMKVNRTMGNLLNSIRRLDKITGQNHQIDLHQLKQIRSRVMKLTDDGRKAVCSAFYAQADAALIDSPVGYLLTMLDREYEDERNWNK